MPRGESAPTVKGASTTKGIFRLVGVLLVWSVTWSIYESSGSRGSTSRVWLPVTMTCPYRTLEPAELRTLYVILPLVPLVERGNTGSLVSRKIVLCTGRYCACTAKRFWKSSEATKSRRNVRATRRRKEVARLQWSGEIDERKDTEVII